MFCQYDTLLTHCEIQDIIKSCNEILHRPLRYQPYAQASVITYCENGIAKIAILQSYATLVAAFDYRKKRLYCIGTFSNTTRKHISSFAKEINNLYHCNIDYYSFKNSIEDTYNGIDR